jgi:hypothetical protein
MYRNRTTVEAARTAEPPVDHHLRLALGRPAIQWETVADPGAVALGSLRDLFAAQRALVRTFISDTTSGPGTDLPRASKSSVIGTVDGSTKYARQWLPSLSRRSFPPVDGAPVVAVVKQTALDHGCGSAL